MDLFHEYRLSNTSGTCVEINGSIFGNLIAKAKTLTYEKYKNQNLKKPIPKSEM